MTSKNWLNFGGDPSLILGLGLQLLWRRFSLSALVICWTICKSTGFTRHVLETMPLHPV